MTEAAIKRYRLVLRNQMQKDVLVTALNRYIIDTEVTLHHQLINDLRFDTDNATFTRIDLEVVKAVHTNFTSSKILPMYMLTHHEFLIIGAIMYQYAFANRSSWFRKKFYQHHFNELGSIAWIIAANMLNDVKTTRTDYPV